MSNCCTTILATAELQHMRYNIVCDITSRKFFYNVFTMDYFKKTIRIECTFKLL